jgi:chromate transporter
VRTWFLVGLQSFGGPAGQIAVMHRILVGERRWIGEARFLHALNYCMLLPGPEAMQLATYVGWLMHRTVGGLVAGILFVLPGFLSILALSLLYATHRDLALVQGIFFGLKPAVLAVVVHAVIRLGRRALRNAVLHAIAAAAFVAIFCFNVPFPAIIAAAALCGLIGCRVRPGAFPFAGHAPGATGGGDDSLLGERIPDHARPTMARAGRVLVVWLALWLIPIAILRATLGPDDVFSTQGVFFSTAAVVTFGGAYSVLAYIAQQAVEVHHWLAPGEMLDGLGMAETTPGPLIQVVQFVGFMGAYRDPGPLHPLLAGTLASVLVTWVTFVPCFLWIFLGAPWIETLRGSRPLGAALSAITAAVVGVVLNLALWFALHTLFADVTELRALGLHLPVPDPASLDLAAAAIGAVAALLLFRVRLSMLATLGVSAALGLVVVLVQRATTG